MPDSLHHRGRHPADDLLFAPQRRPALAQAVDDLSLLLTRGYAVTAAARLVGDHFQLDERLRKAVERCACVASHASDRNSRRVGISAVAGRALDLDGYNVLITLEAALSGGYLFRGRDGALRDIASVHGTYRRVEETIPALRLLAQFLSEAGVVSSRWLLDAPVSNSGRLKALIEGLAAEVGVAWTVEVVRNPDPILAASKNPVASSDSWILDRCEAWLDLPAALIQSRPEDFPKAEIVEIGKQVSHCGEAVL